MIPWRARLWLVGGTAVGGLALIFLTFLPFGSPLTYGQRLLYEATGVPGFSPAVLLFFLAGILGIPPSYPLLYGLAAATAVAAPAVESQPTQAIFWPSWSTWSWW